MSIDIYMDDWADDGSIMDEPVMNDEGAFRIQVEAAKEAGGDNAWKDWGKGTPSWHRRRVRNHKISRLGWKIRNPDADVNNPSRCLTSKGTKALPWVDGEEDDKLIAEVRAISNRLGVDTDHWLPLCGSYVKGSTRLVDRSVSGLERSANMRPMESSKNHNRSNLCTRAELDEVAEVMMAELRAKGLAL